MSVKAGLTIFAIAILIFGVALLFPSLVEINGNSTQTMKLQENESAELTEGLTVTIDNVTNASAAVDRTVNATFSDETTFNSSSVTDVNESYTKNTTLSNDTLYLTNEEVRDENTTVVSFEYPPLFSWGAGPRAFIENLHIVMALLGFLVVLSGLIISTRMIP